VSWSILEGDCIEVMRDLPAESVDAIFTSPPYAMQRKATYGGVPESEYPAWTVAWMREARRLLKPDGSVIINIRPHIRNGQISDYTLRTRLALREDGWCEVDELIWHKIDAMPTGSPRKPRRSWESLHWFATHGQPFSDARANGRQMTDSHRKRFSGTAERNGWDHGIVGGNSDLLTTSRCQDIIALSKVNRRQDYEHPAPFPHALAEWVGKLICPQGGTILDPFSGSASTGVAAIRNGWDYIGIEQMPEYAAMSRKRLAHTEAELAA
jgi:DNA modification methylase